jgi:5-methylcytosine-specific restriction protein A
MSYDSKQEAIAMPYAPKRPCRQPGCGTLVESGYCDRHKRTYRPRTETPRPTVAERGYSGEHTKTRMRVIHRDQTCRECGRQLWRDGKPVKGATAHHVIPRRYGGSDDEANMIAVCAHPCHQTVEARWMREHGH